MSVCACPHCIHITAWHAKSSHLGYHLLLNDPRQKNMSQHRRASNASLSSSVMGTYFSEQNKVSPPKMFPYPIICFFKKPLEFLQKAHIHCKKKIKGKLIKNPFFFIQTYLICWWLSGTRLLLWTNSFRLCMQGLCLPSRIKEWQCTTTPTTPTCTSTSPNCALQQFGRQLQLLDNLKGVTCDRETHPLHLTRAIQRDEEGKIGEHRIMGWPRQTVDAPKLFQDPSGSPLPS